MFCEECGKQIPDNSKFCDGCGAPVKPVNESQVSYEEPVYQQRPFYGSRDFEPYGEPEYEEDGRQKKGRASTIVIIILSVAAVALIGVLIFLGIRAFGGKKDGGENGRMVTEETGSGGGLFGETEKSSKEEAETVIPESTSAAAETTAAETVPTQPQTTVAPTTEAVSEYILPTSNSVYLTEADLASLSREELRLARNEIYARHGRKFKDASLNEYFLSKSWYVPSIEPNQFNESVFNDYEVANRKLIADYEKKMGY